jgi:hypothetical protein
MPRRLPEELKKEKLVHLCLASRIADAKKIESVLDKANIDYTFEITPVYGTSVFSVLFGTIKNGVMFLVRSEQYELCISLLEKEGLSDLIIG